MSSRSFLFKLGVLVGVLICFAGGAHAQREAAPESALSLTAPLHTALYPEVMCVGCVVPDWDGDYLLHKEADKDPAAVTVYDRSGNKVLTARIALPEYSHVVVHTESVTQAGGILAGAAGNWSDGTRQGFLAETDSAGRTVRSVATPGFETHQVCEGADGTAWTLGEAWGPPEVPQAERNVLRHYDFEQGLLEGFIPAGSLAKREGISEVTLRRQSYLHCGKERVSVYLALSGRYIEIDTSSKKVSHWEVDMSSVVASKDSKGFAVTDNRRIFVAFRNSNCVADAPGLYEMHAAPDQPVASLTRIGGAQARTGGCEEAIARLWGADGDELVVQKRGSWTLEWVKVSDPSGSQ